MSKEIEKRIQALEKHPVEYIQSRIVEFNEATSNPQWMTTHIKKIFNKQINPSSKDSSGYGALLTARSRSPFMVYSAQSRILNGQFDGWNLIFAALNNIWWTFRCRPSTYLDYESLVQLMLPWFDICGYKNRKDFLGLYFSGKTGLDGYENFTRYSFVGRFVTRIWLWESGDYSSMRNINLQADSKRSFYNDLIDSIESSDSTALSGLIVNAFDNHIRSASTENGEFITAYPFHLFPLEIYYYINARKRKNIETKIPEHPMLDSYLSQVDCTDFRTLDYDDSILLKALGYATQTGWLSEPEVNEYNLRNVG